MFFCPVKDIYLYIHYTFIQNWNTNLTKSSRANTYNLYAEFNFKSYLGIITVNKFRIYLSRLRISSHRIEIETGRWTNQNNT